MARVFEKCRHAVELFVSGRFAIGDLDHPRDSVARLQGHGQELERGPHARATREGHETRSVGVITKNLFAKLLADLLIQRARKVAGFPVVAGQRIQPPAAVDEPNPNR